MFPVKIKGCMTQLPSQAKGRGLREKVYKETKPSEGKVLKISKHESRTQSEEHWDAERHHLFFSDSQGPVLGLNPVQVNPDTA